MESNGKPWKAMESHGKPWKAMESPKKSIGNPPNMEVCDIGFASHP